MKWSELRRVAEAYGWRFVRHGGAHDIYAHPDKKSPLIIERHGNQEVKKDYTSNLKSK